LHYLHKYKCKVCANARSFNYLTYFIIKIGRKTEGTSIFYNFSHRISVQIAKDPFQIKLTNLQKETNDFLNSLILDVVG